MSSGGPKAAGHSPTSLLLGIGCLAASKEGTWIKKDTTRGHGLVELSSKHWAIVHEAANLINCSLLE